MLQFLASADAVLEAHSYVDGYSASSLDAALLRLVGGAPDAGRYPHLARWHRHVQSLQRLGETFPAAGAGRSLRDCGIAVPEGSAARARSKMKDKKGGGDKAKASSVKELNPWPAYIQERLALWDRLKAKADAEVAAKEPQKITVTLPDGKEVEGQSWRTTPYDVAKGISQGLADNTVIAKVNGELWDLDRPLEGDATLQLLKFDSDEGKYVFWHSTAHILGEAMERVYGGCLCYGPPIEEGFYYDMHLEDGQVSSQDFDAIETVMKSAIKEKQTFERLEISKEDLLEMFRYNKFKVRILEERVKTPTTTAYRCGPLIDLCRGPHVRHTGKIKAFKVTKNSATYWEGKADAESLQRVYGVSFPDTKQLKEWQHFQEEAAKRDHRKIGRLYRRPGTRCMFRPGPSVSDPAALPFRGGGCLSPHRAVGLSVSLGAVRRRRCRIRVCGAGRVLSARRPVPAAWVSGDMSTFIVPPAYRDEGPEELRQLFFLAR
ncbi:Threonine--tRNA ligase, cytoplasmic [Amphibalanus amphitrite]|uniref:threonine--tRNA ligase n=1 Tax=Amphibalanus amphitrite TaxID=1232801 RepID=A0A6A4VIG4_AMPAM|nr:Threonine--tRNA ligase, cytoplasmic [Amphibalanus amphitrite]